jgi:hypothetical protein
MFKIFIEREAQCSYLAFIVLGLPETDICMELETLNSGRRGSKVFDVRNAMRVKAPEL